MLLLLLADTDLSDIKRVIVNTHAIEPQALVEYFGTLSGEPLAASVVAEHRACGWLPAGIC